MEVIDIGYKNLKGHDTVSLFIRWNLLIHYPYCLSVYFTKMELGKRIINHIPH